MAHSDDDHPDEPAAAATAAPHAYRMGRLGFTIAGSDPVVPYLLDEFEPLLGAGPIPGPHLAFVFSPDLPRLSDYVTLSPLDVGRDAYRAKHGGLEYVVTGSPPSLRVHIRSSKNFGVERVTPAWLLRAGDKNHLLPSEKVAKNFMYNVFDYLSQLANLALGQSYLHASSFERDGRAVAIAAWGGVGKTTAMLKLVGQAGWRFLSDDLALVDAAGTLWRTPKRLQIYAYNVQGQPQLYRTLMSGRSALDRAAWHTGTRLSGVKRVRRRVSAEELFGPGRAATSARLTDLFAMERADVPALAVEPISIAELCRRAATTILRETQPLGDLTAAMYSGGMHPVLPTQERFFRDTEATLKQGLGRVTARLVRVPLAASPDDLAAYLTDLLDEG